jgi:glyoxylase I family protein
MKNDDGRDWHLQSIFHFVVNASNLERSLAFYQTLGFTILSDRRDVIWPGFVANNFGVNKAQGRGCLLGLGDNYLPDQTRLDLVEWLEPRLHDDSGGLALEERVPRIMALRTHNVWAAYDALHAKGIEFMTPPMTPNESTGVKGLVCCRDPDGLIVELIEYFPGVFGSITSVLPTRSE